MAIVRGLRGEIAVSPGSGRGLRGRGMLHGGLCVRRGSRKIVGRGGRAPGRRSGQRVRWRQGLLLRVRRSLRMLLVRERGSSFRRGGGEALGRRRRRMVFKWAIVAVAVLVIMHRRLKRLTVRSRREHSLVHMHTRRARIWVGVGGETTVVPVGWYKGTLMIVLALMSVGQHCAMVLGLMTIISVNV
jgi:hypothetical protein